jgi:hypothetical protein
MAIQLQLDRVLQGSFDLKALNHLPGTPIFLLVDQNLQLLDGWFGLTPEAAVIERIEKHLCSINGVTQELCR